MKTFWDFCNEAPDEVAIVEVDGSSWSRGSVGRGSCQIRDYLVSRDVGVGVAVAIVAPNCAEFLIGYLGITMCGARAVPVNFHLAPDEVGHILRTSNARIVLVASGVITKIDSILNNNFHSDRPPLAVAIESLLDDKGLEQGAIGGLSIPVPPVLGRTMLFTSATTGRPKAIRYSDDNAYESLANLIRFREHMGMRVNSGVVHLCVAPLYHAGPLEGATVTLHMGNTVVLMRTWEVRSALKVIEKHRVTHAFLVPVMIAQLSKISCEERSAYDTSSLRVIMHAGAPCPREAKRDVISWLGPIVYESYGASEGGGTFTNSDEWLKYPGTVGRAIPGAEISIRGLSGERLPANTEGRIFIRSYSGGRFEYVGEKALTDASFCGDHFTVGDIGYINEEGYLFISGRSTDLILCGGANIYPAEIEAVLSDHPGVADCAVIGRPDDNFGEVVHALVQPTSEWTGAEDELSTDIVRHAYKRLAPMKLPRTYEFVSKLPRDPNGKLIRRYLEHAPVSSVPHS